MYRLNIEWVVRKGLSPWKQCVFALLLQGNGREAAEEFLLEEIDHLYRSGEASFVEAAEYYYLLQIPQEHMLQVYREVHLGEFH